MILLHEQVINLVPDLTFTETVKLEVTDLLWQRECLALLLQEQPSGLVRLVKS